MISSLTRLSDVAIEARLAACPEGHVRQTLLAIRMERDIETWLCQHPDREADLRPAFAQALAAPEHRRWIGGPDPTPVGWRPRFNGDPHSYRCEAITASGRQCLRGSSADGLCTKHRMMQSSE